MSHAAEKLSVARVVGEPSLSGSAPRGLRFSPDGEAIMFLRGKATKSDQLDLYTLRLDTLKESLLIDSSLLDSGMELSDAEKARRERQRIAALSGIVDYTVAPNGQQVLVPLNGDVFLFDLRTQKTRKLLDGKEGAAIDSQFSPKGNFVSFVRAQNLYVVAVKDGKVTALSTDGGGVISNGSAEFVAQEEMNRFSGYWWLPDESAVVMQRVDESPVPVAKRFEIYADRTEIVEQRYPAAGSNNVNSNLYLVPLQTPTQRVELKYASSAEAYLTRVNVSKDSKAIYVQRQSRNQRLLELVRFDRNGSMQKVMDERSATFINLHENFRELDGGKSFLWSSERDGYNHLYRFDANGKLEAQLTAGNWAVDGVLAINEKAGLVYFNANVGDAKQKHVYAQSPVRVPKAITTAIGTHNAVFNSQGSRFLDTYSDVLTPPQVRLHDASGKVLKIIAANAIDAAHPLHPYMPMLSMPEFGEIKLNDRTLEYRMIKPKRFDPNKRYPVLIYTYGGPHVQVLSRAFDARWGMLLQTFAQHDVIVFTLDNRGSARRGKAFEEAIYQRMGQVDVADQLAGIEYLRGLNYVDPSRIAIMGWSYGGYMSLHVWAQAGDKLRAAIAGAPVTDWGLYDTHYTERYMNLPSENAEGYEVGTVFSQLDKHARKGRLLLIHGMADDNVLFSNSTQLMSRLQQAGTRFDLMTYPGMKHGPNTPETRRHVYEGMLEFLQRELKLVN
jgi:dipeptidyl-peptidase 4